MKTNKGEVRDIDAQGTALKAVIKKAGFTIDDCKEVHVTADDGYYAVLTPEELEAEHNVCLILQEEGPRLIVFSDSGSKRNVSHVVSVTLVPHE